VSYLFNRKGVVLVPRDQAPREVDEDAVLEATLDAGAEEVNDLGDSFEVIAEATDLVAVRTALQAAGLDYDSAEASFVPSMNIELGDGKSAGAVLRLVDALEDLDDVQDVFANFDVSDEILESLEA
jgi:transcriptional/translational regulatory protein YebC/TACO1